MTSEAYIIKIPTLMKLNGTVLLSTMEEEGRGERSVMVIVLALMFPGEKKKIITIYKRGIPLPLLNKNKMLMMMMIHHKRKINGPLTINPNK